MREATPVERLAYTRTQAAEALGISRSTFNRRVLPYIETVEMPWGTRLVPVDELERLLAERRRPNFALRREDRRPPRRLESINRLKGAAVTLSPNSFRIVVLVVLSVVLALFVGQGIIGQ